MIGNTNRSNHTTVAIPIEFTETVAVETTTENLTDNPPINQATFKRGSNFFQVITIFVIFGVIYVLLEGLKKRGL